MCIKEDRRRDFYGENGAGIGVFHIYIDSAVAEPFAQEQRLLFDSFDYLFSASVRV